MPARSSRELFWSRADFEMYLLDAEIGLCAAASSFRAALQELTKQEASLQAEAAQLSASLSEEPSVQVQVLS